MKNIKLGLLGAIVAATMWLGSVARGQTNLNFISITATVESAMSLSWNSTSNEIYEIDEADALATNSDGSTAWNMLYSDYGTTIDYNANRAKQMYFPITHGQTAQYIGMAEMNFGSSGANGLKWMAIAACNSLQHTDWASMQNAGVQPYNGNLHLILGTDSVVSTGDDVTSYWAKYTTIGKTNGIPMTIQAAWYEGAKDAYRETGFIYPNAMYFAASGDSACQFDTLQTNSTPTGNPFYNSVKVWPLP